MASIGPPAHLLTGKVGSEKWHKDNRNTVLQAKELTRDYGQQALDLWRAPGQPEETPYERKVRKESWKFKLDVSSTGEVNRKPPEGPGVTLWKSKLKPPPWVCKMALPCFRDYFNTKNNEYVSQYTRETRQVVSRMRQALAEINEQFKALVRERESLNTTLARIRQSLITNKQTQAIREHRPTLEKIPDKVDALMKWEKEELLKQKVKLEGVMAMSEDHLKALGTCRQALETACDERSRVLDLMPHPLRMVLLEAGRDSWLGLDRPSSPWVERNQTPNPDPIGPYTPECEAALDDARRLTFVSKDVMQKVKEAIKLAQDTRNTAYTTIANSLQGKRDETMRHKERLDMALGGTRGTLHRCKRFMHEMCVTQGMTLGPENSKYLETREKLTRPMVQVFQRHVGTQLPEAAILNKSTALLDRSIKDTAKNIHNLQDTRQHLQQCIHDKETGYGVDGSIKRLRQRRIHPRTCLQETLDLVYS
ncbi:tektin-like protein 1 [Heteronotia binoei]|uniref:tektin-like protein 1 n=1 Tax=Heteronotia binoei TaxID=13085 RepID=UPI00292E99FA|nr:tektin-like protein 1 [Heteronotia binoei]XP_060095287.1 tektin-like protein 1 [Heteronotia binoei]